MRRLLALALAAAATPDEGYLFVTNRGDEAVASARSLRRVAPHANITFVSDAATLRDVGPSLQVFDVVIRAEKAFPDLDVHDSQGFRLQKLRGGLASPYERTIFLDSDTRACKDPGATLFPLATKDGRGLRLGRPRQPLRRVGRRVGLLEERALERVVEALGGRLPHGHATDAPRAAFISSGRAQGERRRSKGGETPDDL